MATTTENYGLKQWEESDPVNVGEINENFAVLDAALGAMPQLRFGSYVGTGTYGSSNMNSITFEFVPKFVLIYDNKSYYGICMIPNSCGDLQFAYYRWGHDAARQRLTWNGTTLSWYCDWAGPATGGNYTVSSGYQMNTSGQTYYYMYF